MSTIKHTVQMLQLEQQWAIELLLFLALVPTNALLQKDTRN